MAGRPLSHDPPTVQSRRPRRLLQPTSNEMSDESCVSSHVRQKTTCCREQNRSCAPREDAAKDMRSGYVDTLKDDDHSIPCIASCPYVHFHLIDVEFGNWCRVDEVTPPLVGYRNGDERSWFDHCTRNSWPVSSQVNTLLTTKFHSTRSETPWLLTTLLYPSSQHPHVEPKV